MGKKFTKLVFNLWKKPLAKIFFYVIFLVALLYVSTLVNGDGVSLLQKVVDIVLKDETLSFLSAGIFTLILAYFVKRINIRFEERLKLDHDHHKIIKMYKGHSKDDVDKAKNFYNKNGFVMKIKNTKNFKQRLKEDDQTKTFKNDHIIFLPTVNIFTNVNGNTKIKFEDNNQRKEPTGFVDNNYLSLLGAHKYSKTSNNVTIRLDDISFEENTLTLNTSRSTYFDMLATNRCMDYELENKITIRKLYEFNSTITPLKDSCLSNQIGINGLIITKDNCLLIEKRGMNKTTWKNKFAQPISLALKENDLALGENKTMESSTEFAEEKLLNIIKKTIKSNFGLTEEDYQPLSLQTNFMGIARDLLEGGKPNMYFVVFLNYDSNQLNKKLTENAKSKQISKEKLKSEYYIIPYEQILVD